MASAGHGSQWAQLMYDGEDSDDSEAEAEAVLPPITSSSSAPLPSTSATTGASSSSHTNGASARLPLLPWYLGKVKGLSSEANEQCLGLQDVLAGEWTKVNKFACVVTCLVVFDSLYCSFFLL